MHEAEVVDIYIIIIIIITITFCCAIFVCLLYFCYFGEGEGRKAPTSEGTDLPAAWASKEHGTVTDTHSRTRTSHAALGARRRPGWAGQDGAGPPDGGAALDARDGRPRFPLRSEG